VVTYTLDPFEEAGQVKRTTEGFIALWEGRTRNPAALLFGAPRP